MKSLKVFFFLFISLAIGVQAFGAEQDDPCAGLRARAKVIADPLGQPQLFATYDQNPDRLQSNLWSKETRAGVSFDLARFSEGRAIRSLAETECELWQKRKLLMLKTSGAQNALTIKALQKKRQVFVEMAAELERETAGVNLQGTLEQQDQLEKYILQQKTQIADIDEHIFRLDILANAPDHDAATDVDKAEPLTDPEAAIRQLEQEHRDYEAERAKTLRVNRSNLVLSGGTIQREAPGSVGDRDRLPYFFGVELRVPISDFMMGSRAEAMVSAKNDIQRDPYFENLRVWLVNFKAERQRLFLLSDLFRQRIRSIEKRLGVVQRNGGVQFAQLARSLKVQLSEVQGELAYNNVILGSARISATTDAQPRAAVQSSADGIKPKGLENFRLKMLATEGQLLESTEQLGFYSVKDERLRAKAVEPVPSRLDMTFTYEGQTAVAKNLKSGKPRVQLGCYLAAKNQCNLLYAMWRIAPEPGIFVQTKANPNQGTHAECGNNGYATVKPTFRKKIGVPEAKRAYRYSCELAANILTVKIDNEKVWSGPVDFKDLDPKGYTGVRSDNAVWNFAVIKEDSNR